METEQRQCVIVIEPDNDKCCLRVETGGVTSLEILDILSIVNKHFARKICEEYQDITCDVNIDDTKLDDYMKFLRTNKL